MPSIARALAEYAPQLAKWVAPVAERVAQQVVQALGEAPARRPLATPLTQANRSAGRDGVRVKAPAPERPSENTLPSACRVCGVILENPTRAWCDECLPEARVEKDRVNIAIALRAKAELRAAGKDPSHGAEVAKKRGATHREQLRLNAEWQAANAPIMTEAEYRARVMPGLGRVSTREIAAALDVSQGYAAGIKKGQKVPHPRHWRALQAISRID
jgi:hypothetical protein